jgi:hypothetical protein
VDRVDQIRGLLDACPSTRIIRQMLPCLHRPGVIHTSVPLERGSMTDQLLHHPGSDAGTPSFCCDVHRGGRPWATVDLPCDVPGPAGDRLGTPGSRHGR